MKGKEYNLFDYIKLTLQWVEDKITGEMIEAYGYKREYLGFPLITQDDLDFICVMVNRILAYQKSKFRIINNMGEIRGAYIK